MEGGKMVCKTGKFCHIQELKGGEMIEVRKKLSLLHKTERPSDLPQQAMNWTECFFFSRLWPWAPPPSSGRARRCKVYLKIKYLLSNSGCWFLLWVECLKYVKKKMHQICSLNIVSLCNEGRHPVGGAKINNTWKTEKCVCRVKWRKKDE